MTASISFLLILSHLRKKKIIFRGYIEAIREIEEQLQSGTDKVKFDDIVVACGRCFSMPSYFELI